MKIATKQKGNLVIILVNVIGGIVVLGVLGYLFWFNFLKADPPAPAKQDQTQTQTTPETPAPKVASDETLGSGFAVEYPKEWMNVHVGADDPKSATVNEKDINTLTSPSGKIQVILTVQTNTQIGGTCEDGYIDLKYLATDATPQYNEGRFAAYVVYFPSINFYQYHAGLQKNTAAVRSVTLDSNNSCNFFYSEYIRRDSSIVGVPTTTTILEIKFVDLYSGSNLKAGVDETAVLKKLTGTEYDQAKAIVQSVYIK